MLNVKKRGEGKCANVKHKREEGKVHSTMKTNMWQHMLYKLLNNVVFHSVVKNVNKYTSINHNCGY